MSGRLIQKHLLKGTREYEIVGDQLHVRIKTHFKEDETLSITLAVLNPEPVITKSQLHFLSRVNGEPLLSLALSKPNVTEFNNFVNAIKHKAQAEFNAISGMTITDNPSLDSFDEEPPEFDEISHVTLNS